MDNRLKEHPVLVSGYAGAFVFGWLGIFDALSLLFFQGALLQVVGLADTLGMLSNLDTSLFLYAAILYGMVGFAVGMLWWSAESTFHNVLGTFFSTSRKDDKDFYELFIRQVLSIAWLIGLIACAYIDWRQLVTIQPAVSYPALRYGLHLTVLSAVFYGCFRLSFWLAKKIPSVPLLGFIRRPLFHGLCAIGTVALLGVLSVIPYVSSGKPEQAQRVVRYKPTRTPNIVFVVLDTCRADHFSGYGYPRNTTPHIDAFMKEALRFTHAVTPSPWTLPSHASMFTGLYPRSHGASSKHFLLDDSFYTLAEVLRASGYRTVGFSANPMVGRVTHLDQGFDHFDEVWRNAGREGLQFMKLIGSLFGSIRDKGAFKINRRIRTWLEHQQDPSQPFFMFINYLETHGPYSPPREFRERFLDKQRIGPMPASVDIYSTKFVEYLTGTRELSQQELSDLRSMYDAALAYLDMRVKELLDMLKEHDLYETSLIVMVSDHGENLGEHRMVDHQLCVYDTLLLVPLAIRYPPLFPIPGEVEATVQLTSLFPTIVEILGIPESELPISWTTKSLVKVITEKEQGMPITFSEYDSPREILKILKFKAPYFDVSVFDRDLLAARDKRFKYILTSNNTDELYDVVLDPGETNNLLPTRNVPDYLKQAVVEFQRQNPLYRPPSLSATPGKGDKEAIEKLRSLGYIQ